MTARRPSRTKAAPIWCDHCNTYITPAGVRSCVRLTCTTKTALAERERLREAKP